jgi:hypothetical protein
MIEYTFDGKYLRRKGSKVGEVDRTTIRDAHGRKAGQIDGKTIRDAGGNPLAEFDSAGLRNMRGQRIQTTREMTRQIGGTSGITLAALWLLLVRSEIEEE